MSEICRLNISYRSMTGIFRYSRHRDQTRCYAVTPEPDKYLTEGLDTLPQLRDCSSQLTASRTRLLDAAAGVNPSSLPPPISSASRFVLRLLDCRTAKPYLEHLEKISTFTDLSFTKLYERNK